MPEIPALDEITTSEIKEQIRERRIGTMLTRELVGRPYALLYLCDGALVLLSNIAKQDEINRFVSEQLETMENTAPSREVHQRRRNSGG